MTVTVIKTTAAQQPRGGDAMASGERGEQPMGHKVYMESRLYFQISMLSFETLCLQNGPTYLSQKI